jgi:hypothetical protein
MKQIKKLLLIFLLTLWISTTNWYVFGIKSADNTISNIVEIQNKYNFDFKIVGFIFDPRSEDVLWTINNLNTFSWTWKIYHITLSPNSYSAKQVAEWIFDNEYRQFFQTIKDNDLKIIFRTMHEMNWGRYPRWSNPGQFKQARIHVRELSREMWLNQNNILFDFSVNHRDMPTKEIPSQSAKLITCNKYKTDCYKYEDYYPWDEYVDIVWVTFYNRWKATYSRQRYSPNRILNDTNRNTLTRLKSFNKPIFIDEVWTTAVRYSWAYNFLKSKIAYNTDYDKKNERLLQLKDFIIQNPEIIWMTYFNTDFTKWMTTRIPWEADRAIINLENNKIYYWIYDLIANETQRDFEKIKNLFSVPKEEKTFYFSKKQKQDLADLMIEKFWKEESIKRINKIIDYTDNKSIHSLIEDVLNIIENNN